jgi:hypothetical protein
VDQFLSDEWVNFVAMRTPIRLCGRRIAPELANENYEIEEREKCVRAQTRHAQPAGMN